MNSKPIALLFSTVWPEVSSSAAGVRQMQWVNLFGKMGFEVVISSPSKLKPELGLTTRLLPLGLNISTTIDELQKLNPSLVMFDRFILEEQFGHFVYQACPQALVLLETQDLHFVRRARQSLKESLLGKSAEDMNYQTETAIRETASILRVDHAFVISPFEERLLTERFGIPRTQVSWIPFGYEVPLEARSNERTFSEREGFSWIGNFRHAPNVDGLRWFRSEIWPLIRSSIPGAKINVFGAYPSEEVMNWNQPEKGFIVHGPAKMLDDLFVKARVNLAPLRFGAGVKGKLFDGFRYGVPAVTTWIGAEGIEPFPGLIENSEINFAKACVELYQNESLWTKLRKEAQTMMNAVYSARVVDPPVQEQIERLLKEKKTEALPRWNSKILRFELFNSHKYFSKWIEEKEKALNGSKIQQD